jgi:methionyl aminopeptidase
LKQEFVVHSQSEIEGIRKAAHLAALAKENLKNAAVPGMSTKDLDNIAGALFSSFGGKSAFLGYRGFPGNICISLNDEVVHGIGRSDRFFKDGDLVSIDVGINVDGFIGDNAMSFVIGSKTVDPELDRLLKITEKALWSGISAAKNGNYVSDISYVIEKTAKAARFGIVREYVGHGCGLLLHEPPDVPNFTCPKKGPRLRPGMILAIEPMFNLGTHAVRIDSDGWTVRTKDGKNSAHFEHMILITENEPEILTWQKK